MKKRPAVRNGIKLRGSNDNAPDASQSIQVSCLLPESMGILSGEAELIARYLGDILPKIANNNQLKD